MLTITVPKMDLWNEITEEFIHIDNTVLQLEHSLVSLKKWEAKWHKPFLSDKPMTSEETLDYIRCMTLNDVPPEVYFGISDPIIDDITKYINNTMTATTITDRTPGRKSNEIITAELIYYWMFSLGIPMECQEWHLNELLTLIKVCSIKNTPAKKMSKRDILAQNKALNAARRQSLNTKG